MCDSNRIAHRGCIARFGPLRSTANNRKSLDTGRWTPVCSASCPRDTRPVSRGVSFARTQTNFLANGVFRPFHCDCVGQLQNRKAPNFCRKLEMNRQEIGIFNFSPIFPQFFQFFAYFFCYFLEFGVFLLATLPKTEGRNWRMYIC